MNNSQKEGERREERRGGKKRSGRVEEGVSHLSRRSLCVVCVCVWVCVGVRVRRPVGDYKLRGCIVLECAR